MRLKELKPEDYHIYVDLDGVLADLESRVERILGHPIQTDPNTGNWANDNEIWKELRAKNEPNFAELELLPDAMQLWNYVKKYNPNVLTATGHPVEKNSREKKQWAERNLSGYDKIYTVVASRNKAKFAWPDSILIDDRMKSIGPWRERGGIGILHTSANDTIAQLKQLGL